ncbi:hypothetical protein LTR47_011208 [Exophiala xenobiotica]|nr:hypothetical protein LTR72_011622 [Exophiala xenobiotica]KAK5220342.1 hypothetical protein LTR47_011208 [Exophiala xenobiotica]KAK5245313.1 hypothetical protein LTS06_009227 [Exophiala xenobiotica]KAK5260346.1 hypothetical protein LTR40_004316 [Exophiala xenobiotica]KAK5284422.1 hypothetical protein LTR14_011692 [Exophiala xenobiotica]
MDEAQPKFPGEIPVESTGVVTANAILNGLGLTTPDHEDPTSSVPRTQHNTSTVNADPREKDQPLITPPAESDFGQNEYPAMSQPSVTKSPSAYARQISTASPSLHPPISREIHFDLSGDMQPQHVHESPPRRTSEPQSRVNQLSSASKAPGPWLNADSYLDVDTSLDTGSCAFPDTFQPAYHRRSNALGTPSSTSPQLLPTRTAARARHSL